MKSRRGFYNLIFGLGSQLIILALGIVIPRLFLLNFGSEINGLIASISQIFVYLTLLEAGVGAATLQALYKPVSECNYANINGVLAATSSYYKKAGGYYFFAVVALSILYPFLISTQLNTFTIMIVILLAGMGGVLNFFFQGKYILLLTAEGKSYINTTLVTIISILASGVKIILLTQGFNIIILQLAHFIIIMIQILLINIYIKRNYKWVDLTVKPNFDAIKQKNSVVVHEVSTLIFRNTDIILLTIFCNLKVVSVYVLYNMLFGIIDSIVNTVHSSVTFALGQTFHENKAKFVKLYDSFEVLFMAIVFALFSVAYVLIIPFMRLYTEGINDINYIDFWLPTLFVMLKLLSLARTPSNILINIIGHFKETKNSSIIEASINLIVSLLLVNIIGIYGVLCGTIIALLYRSTEIIFYTSRKILYRTPWIPIRRWLINMGIFIIFIGGCSLLNISPITYIQVFLWAVILCVVMVPAYLLISFIFEKAVYNYTLNYFKVILLKVLNLASKPKSFIRYRG
ncbi:polysaccharide biosynthesis C-terminal domain-containing protein [Bacillus sp. MRMR6]|uniref:polysaccharide biosynthesis C-terminal domain-containing protein n=1 Tax=Bacillus sp. MRMR6 TaxID=1928617 RepID=UPI000950FFC2|nr:polysaccharide biosynthesis C-terminal domain-containing protein [Bacillus sp. MRMR6]OLS38437.1 sugar isomerase [Bacillus sp. MRMR6]